MTAGGGALGGLSRAYGRLPRWGRWLTWAGAGLAAYFVAIEPAIEVAAAAHAQADAARARILALADEAARAQADAQAVALGSRVHGPIAEPKPRPRAAGALSRAIDDALRDAGVRDARTQTIEQPMPEGPVTRAFGGRDALVRLESTIQFEAPPEAFSAVLAALEDSPDIAGVSRLTVRRAGDGSRRVSVSITVEVWALSPGARSVAGGGS